MATIHDVAKAAGVSISTVSYALSGKRAISAATRGRIDRAIAELDYRPHAAARILAGARTNILALSAPLREDGHLPTHMRFVTAVVQASRASNYDVLLLATDDEVSGIRRVASTSLVDGVVMMGVANDDERVPLVHNLGLPAAFIGVPNGASDAWCVDLDFEAAARLSVERLAELGHTSVGVIGHPHSYLERHTGFITRYRDAFEAAAAQRGMTVISRWPHVARGEGAAAARSILDEDPTVSAIVFHCNEPVVDEAVRALMEAGRRVPEDISLLAACASYDAESLHRPLSSIPLPIEEMCRRAVNDALRGVDGAADHGVSYLAPRYLDRGSLAPAR